MKRALLIIIALSLLVTPACNEKCGIQECHGFIITCGSNISEMCTEEYRLGDYCRQFIDCKIINGECQAVEQPEYNICKECMTRCFIFSSMTQAFECEQECREAIAELV